MRQRAGADACSRSAASTEPIYVTSAPEQPRPPLRRRAHRDGSSQVENGNRTVFADISSLVSCCASEGGLLSIALSPDFQTSGRLFVYYTRQEETPAEIHVAEMRGERRLGPVLAACGTCSRSHTRTTPTTTAGSCSSGRKGTSSSPPATAAAATTKSTTPRTSAASSARSSASTPIPGRSSTGSRPATPLPATRERKRRSGASACATPSASPSTATPATSGSATSARTQREEVDYAPAPGLGGGANYGWNCREGFLSGPATDEGCAQRVASPTRSSTTRRPPTGGDAPTAARSSAATSPAAPATATSSGATSTATSASATSARFSPAPPVATRPLRGRLRRFADSFGEDSCGRLYAISGTGPVYRLVGPGGDSCTPAAQPAALKSSFLGIRALRRKVKRNKRALITAFVSPCDGRRGSRSASGKAGAGSAPATSTASARYGSGRGSSTASASGRR